MIICVNLKLPALLFIVSSLRSLITRLATTLPAVQFLNNYLTLNPSYRFVILADGKAANAIEAAIKGGKWEPGKPLLNPGK